MRGVGRGEDLLNKESKCEEWGGGEDLLNEESK